MELSDPLPEFLITRVRVDRRRQRTHMSREPLGEKEIPRCSVDVRDCGVPQRMERIEPVEPGLHLPRPEGDLDSPRRDPALTSL